MSYGSENYTSSSSYRKNSGDSPSYAPSPSRTTMSFSRAGGYRSSSLSRRHDSSVSSFRRKSGRSISMPLEPSYDPQSSDINDKIKMIRTSEKVQMQGLNNRFATFIEKVHKLEQQNNMLVTTSNTYTQWQTEPSRLAETYQQEIRELRSQLDELNGEKSQLVVERDRIEDDLQEYIEKYEEEYRAREDAEFILKEFKKDVDRATVERMNMEKKMEPLLDEINFLKKVHKQEVTELTVRFEQINVSVGTGVSTPDLTSALSEIRAQYEFMVSNQRESAVEWYQTKFAELSEQAARSTEVIHASREEINEFRRQLKSKTIEIEELRVTNESREKQFHEMEENTLRLENDQRLSKSNMARHTREYQDLLNVKMALDFEIAAYRKLLEGEENRIGMGNTYSGSSAGQRFSQGIIFTSSSEITMKEDEVQQQSKSGGKIIIGVTEETEETAVTDAMEKQQDPSDIPTNQNN